MRLHELAVLAMRAGLRGKPLPDFGPLPKDQLLLVNSIYDEARNWRAGEGKRT